MPPPTIAAIEAEWCGARKGRRVVRRPLLRVPAIEAIIETSRSSAGDKGGRIEGSRAAIIDLPAPGGPTMNIVSSKDLGPRCCMDDANPRGYYPSHSASR